MSRQHSYAGESGAEVSNSAVGEIRYLEKHTKRPPDLLFGVQELSPSFDEIPSDSPKESVRDVYLAITGCLDDDVEEIQSLGRTLRDGDWTYLRDLQTIGATMQRSRAVAPV